MNPKTTLVMGIGLVVVFGTLAVLKLVNAPTDTEIAARRDKVVPQLHDVDADQVAQISLKRENEEFDFKYVEAGDRWQMTKPLDVLAQTSTVRELFFDLKNLSRRAAGSSSKDTKAGVFAPKTPTDLVEYGLDSPSSTVAITYKPKGSSENKTVTLQVGAPTADKDGLYVKVADEKFVFVVNKSNLRSIEKKTADFRQQKLVNISRFDSDLLSLEWQDRKIEAEKKDAKWHLVHPVSDRADANKVEELIGKLGDLKADGDADYVDNNASDLAQYGLDAPQLVAEIRKTGSKPKSDDVAKGKSKEQEKEKPTIVEKVLIGKPVEGREDKVYAKLADQNYVIAVSASVVNDLAKQPNDLRSRDLVEVTSSDVDFVRIQRPSGAIALGKKDFDWEIYQPKEIKAEQSAVTDLVKKIDELDIKEFVDQGNAAEYGLDQPALTVAIWQKGLKSDDKEEKEKKDEKKEETKDGTPEPKGDATRVSFGKIDDEKQLVYVRRGDEPTIFAVSADGLMDIVDRDYLAYRRKQVLSFLQSDVAKLAVHRNDTTTAVERKKEKEEDPQETWRLTEPLAAPADSTAISDILFGFTRLNAKRFYAEGNVDLAEFGLDKPTIRATATLKAVGDKEPEQHVLLIGGVAEPGSHYAKLGTEDLIFSVDQSLVNYLTAELHDRSLVKFDTLKVEGATFTWPDAKLELANKKSEGNATKEWSVVSNDEFKLDTRKVSDLMSFLSALNTERFAQYQGDFAESQGLTPPALTIEVRVEGESNPRTLRIGTVAEEGKRYAATNEKSGPVALVPDDRFKDMLAGPNYFAEAEAPKPDSKPEEKPEPATPDEAKKDAAKSEPAEGKKEEEKKEVEKEEKKEEVKKEEKEEERKKEQP